MDLSDLEVREVPFEHADASMLRNAQQAEIRSRYDDTDTEPGAKPTAETMSVFLVAYMDGIPAGCGGLRALENDEYEIKRMYVTPAHRGSGLSIAVLLGLEQVARERSARRLVLETGLKQPDAMRFYEREGYVKIDNFGDYIGEELSVCYAKDL